MFVCLLFITITQFFQEELEIDDDTFEDLQSLYQLFDLDRDGILNFNEYQKLLRCLGYRLQGKTENWKGHDCCINSMADKSNCRSSSSNSSGSSWFANGNCLCVSVVVEVCK